MQTDLERLNMKSKDLCKLYCGGKNILLPKPGKLTLEDLKLSTEKNRSWYFSLIGSRPKNPVIALVGLCPGYTQLTALVEHYNATGDFLESSSQASFSGVAKRNIIKMLRRVGLDKKTDLKLNDDFDLNSSDKFFTTSLVKCASLKSGKGRSDAYNPLKFNHSKLCVIKHFINDILRYPSIKQVIIFGVIGKNVVNENLIDGKSIKEILETKNKEVLFLPHPSGANMKSIKEFLQN